MAKRSSFFEDLVELTSKLPWWVGVLLAAISYFYFHSVASDPLVYDSTQGPASIIQPQLFKSFATLLQYIFPFAFGVGALLSALGRFKRRKLLKDVETSMSQSPLSEMSWAEFEMLVGEYYRRQGFQVTESKAGADGGVDLVLRKADETILVQCKQWRSYKVGVKVVREFFGVMVADNATRAVVVTS
ncbi:restriction endonuclease, partial [Pseudomonadota bacterium]